MLYTFSMRNIKSLPESIDIAHTFYIGAKKVDDNMLRNRKITHMPKLCPSDTLIAEYKQAISGKENPFSDDNNINDLFNQHFRRSYVSELIYNQDTNAAVVSLLNMLSAGDVAIGDSDTGYDKSCRSVIADLALVYGFEVCEVSGKAEDMGIARYRLPVPRATYPLVLQSSIHQLNNTMPVDIVMIPMISQNINDTTTGKDIDNLMFPDSSARNKKIGLRYKPDAMAVRNTVCSMVSRYGWDVHANCNMPKMAKGIARMSGIDDRAPVGVLPVFNIDQLRNACLRLMMLATVNNWSYVLMPYVETPHMPWQVILETYQSILDGRFIIADESNISASIVTSQGSAKMFPICCAIGHKPQDMYGSLGYKTSTYAALDKKLQACVKQLINDHGTRKFITGGAQGVEQLFFADIEKVSKDMSVQVENWIYEPFKNFQGKWPSSGAFGQDDYNRLAQIARKNSTLKQLVSTPGSSMDKQGIAKALHDKTRRIVNESDIVIGVYKHDINEITSYPSANALLVQDGKSNSNTLQTLRDAYRAGKAIIIIHPDTLNTTRINF